MKKRIITFLAVVFLLALPEAGRAQTSDSKFPLFDNPAAAQHRCPFDFVVWLDTKSDTYSMTGPPAGATKETGAYMCQRDADQMDYKPMSAR